VTSSAIQTANFRLSVHCSASNVCVTARLIVKDTKTIRIFVQPNIHYPVHCTTKYTLPCALSNQIYITLCTVQPNIHYPVHCTTKYTLPCSQWPACSLLCSYSFFLQCPMHSPRMHCNLQGYCAIAFVLLSISAVHILKPHILAQFLTQTLTHLSNLQRCLRPILNLNTNEPLHSTQLSSPNFEPKR
jgi:hypothetical protein